MLAHCVHHLVAALLTPLLPFIRDEFALDYTQAGVLISAFTISYGISQVPAGWLADRLGARLVLVFGVSGVAVAGLLVGLSNTYIMMVIFLVLMGVMGGGYHPAASPLISASVEPKKRGRILGLHQIGGGASFFLSPLIAIAIASALGWRGSYITLAIPTFIFGIVFYIFLRRSKYAGQTRQNKADRCDEMPAEPGHLRRMVAFLILVVALQSFFTSITSFIPFFLVDEFNTSKETAAVMLSLSFSGGLLAGPLGGYLSDRLGRVPIVLIVSIIACPVIFLLNYVSLGWSLSVILILLGMSMFITMPISEAYIISQTSECNRSTILGIYYFGSRGGSGVLTPLLGYLIDQSSFRIGFTITSVALFIIVIGCSIFLWRSRE
ncbi:MFS transporter [Chloroflexota bacterium]